MTQNRLQPRLTPFCRYVRGVAIVDSALLSRYATGAANIPKGPVLFIPIDAPIVDLSIYFGVREVDGCPVLFFDVMTGGQYYCNVSSAGDREVMAALEHWDRAGTMPIWLQTATGPCGLINRDFKLHEDYRKAFAMSSRSDYLGQLQELFNSMLEPGRVESIIASRTGMVFDRVNVGFLATSSTRPALTPTV